MKAIDVHVPDVRSCDASSMWQWYGNVLEELEGDFLSLDDKEYMREYYHEAGLAQWWRRPFFRRHFAESFHDAAAYLLDSPAEGAIVDLGCGTGTQSLFLALGGAKVIGVDMDTKALEIFQKRKAWYEEKLGRSLDIELYDGNIFEMDMEKFAPVRGVFSMFAFNMMQPSGRLMDQIAPHMTPGSRIVVLDGNNDSLFTKIWSSRRRDVWSPSDFKHELEARSLRVSSLLGGVVIPPQLWRLLPYGMLSGIDRNMCNKMVLAVSHQIMAEMVQDGSQ